MKTPDEIKKGLEGCPVCSKSCAYHAGIDCYAELHYDALSYIQQLEQREWDLFDLLSSAWHGKQYYFKQEDGTVYSRESCQYLTFDQAIDEFAHSLTVVPGNNEFQYETGFLKGFEAAYPKWISVKERLPDDGQRVVGIAENGMTGIMDYRDDGTPFAARIFGDYFSNITHWMHLPCAPKEEA